MLGNPIIADFGSVYTQDRGAAPPLVPPGAVSAPGGGPPCPWCGTPILFDGPARRVWCLSCDFQVTLTPRLAARWLSGGCNRARFLALVADGDSALAEVA